MNRLVPRLVSGRFDPASHKAVWPSTGNYCRGGAFDCALLGCTAVGILPEEMSRERFDWLHQIGAEVIATPGCESNVKEIYDKCWEIRRTRPDCVIFNQFEEFGNACWHYHVTGKTIEEIFSWIGGGSRLSGYVSATGSAGTIAAGDYLRTVHPQLRVVATEALQCPTLYQLRFGGHRIEGIGDKHVPWIHNTKNTDVVTAIDDNAVVNIARLFNEENGRAYLVDKGVPETLISNLDLLGFSGISNVLSCIKTAKYYEMDENDIMLTVLTDSMELYRSRLHEMSQEFGEYTERDAAADFARYLHGESTDNMLELRYTDRRRVHNLKYFTWVEQQGVPLADFEARRDPSWWTRLREENQRLLQWQTVARRLEAENESLRTVLRLPGEPGVRFISARVVAESGGAFVRSMLVNAGSDDGAILSGGTLRGPSHPGAGRRAEVGEALVEEIAREQRLAGREHETQRARGRRQQIGVGSGTQQKLGATGVIAG